MTKDAKPETRIHRLVLTVEAPANMPGQQVAGLVDFIIGAGLSDACESDDLDEEDQMGPVEEVLLLEIGEATVAPPDTD